MSNPAPDSARPPGAYSPLWYALGQCVFGVIFRTVFRRKIQGHANIPPRGGFFIAANHQSYLDPPFIGTCFPYPIYYFARKSLWDSPVMALGLPRVNVLPIDQERPDIRGMRAALRVVEDGLPLVVFPEGSRTEDGQLQRGQPGVGLLVAKAGAPVLPVRIRGAFEAWPRGSGRIRLCPISLTVGPLITKIEPAPGLRGQEAYQSISDQIMAAIAAL